MICTSGVGVQIEKEGENGAKSVPRGQGLKQAGLDALDAVQRHQNAVSIIERVEKIEVDMGAMDGKLDLIIASTGMKKTSLLESGEEDIVDEWTKDIYVTIPIRN